jgi:hypothetical protein
VVAIEAVLVSVLFLDVECRDGHCDRCVARVETLELYGDGMQPIHRKKLIAINYVMGYEQPTLKVIPEVLFEELQYGL